MKNRILTNSFRNIKKSFPRFLSLLIMSLLGVFAFAGLQATAPDMINSLDDYLDNHNAYDIKISSTLGLSDDDINTLKTFDGIKEITFSYSKDYLTTINDEDIVINVSSLPTTINKLTLLNGHLPQNKNEIVVEENMLEKSNLKLNDEVKLGEETYIITGTIDSSLHYNFCGFNQTRGQTNIGVGTINYYSFVLEESFNQDYYNSIYITVDEALELTTSSEKYNELVNNVLDQINEQKTILENNRYQKIYNTKEKEIKEKEKEVNDELDAYDSLLKAKKIEINNAFSALQPIFPGLNENNINDFGGPILDTLKSNLLAYNTSLNEYNEKVALAESEISEAYNKLDEIDKPVYYINDRTVYQTYTEFIDDTNSVKNLSLIFPVVFFSVAVLISLISMNRLVEADRNEIGTLKSLGFSNRQILTKYITFSSIATLLGGIVGSALGIIIIPKLIFSIYSLLFTLPKFILGLNLTTTLLGFVISFICVCGATLFTVSKVLREKPSDLMRPKSPKPGKRILLEKSKFIWGHLNFSKKITIRNLFRYKKRAIITIVGIIGCTALMLSGFGIKDSIVDIPTRQYGDVFKFDGMAYITDDVIINNEEITSTTYVKNVATSVDGFEVNLFVAKNKEELERIVNIENNDLENNKVIISEKLSSLLSVKVGEKITIDELDGTYEVSAIVTNYIEHFVFINQETYEKSGEEYTPNVIYFNAIEMNDEEKNALSSSLLENDNIISVSFSSSLIEKASNMLKSLDKVVVILIVLSSLLSFVVLYNLSNINITERKREIATLKVLGFYPNEVDGYITRENIILTIIGIIIGLIVGYFLTNIIVGTVEIEKARFVREIKIWSYIYSGVLALLFTLVVNVFTHFSLKKIDMIESLKSVE